MQTQIEFTPVKVYHNTTGLIGSQLQDCINTVIKQDAVVLEIFKKSKLHLTPSEVLTCCELKGYKYLITSVRRTINTLTNKGDLMHTANTKAGPHGRPEGIWVFYLQAN